MTWKANGSSRELEDSTYLAIPGRNGPMPTVDYWGKKDALIRAGVVTEEMLRLDTVDNGFGVTSDDYGNDMTFIENYSGPGVYLVTKYIQNQDLDAEQKDAHGKSISDVDIAPILKRFSNGK